jgi:predicted nuclease of predicted toxin-antitoxin system
MVIVLDENVSLTLASALRQADYEVIAIAETAERGMVDAEVWKLAKARQAILITRDYGFTNPVRFRTQEVGALIYLRRANLSSEKEAELVMSFLTAHKLKEEYDGRLITLWPGGVRIR